VYRKLGLTPGEQPRARPLERAAASADPLHRWSPEVRRMGASPSSSLLPQSPVEKESDLPAADSPCDPRSDGEEGRGREGTVEGGRGGQGARSRPRR
jgi:hypothetical protein